MPKGVHETARSPGKCVTRDRTKGCNPSQKKKRGDSAVLNPNATTTQRNRPRTPTSNINVKSPRTPINKYMTRSGTSNPMQQQGITSLFSPVEKSTRQNASRPKVVRTLKTPQQNKSVPRGGASPPQAIREASQAVKSDVKKDRRSPKSTENLEGHVASPARWTGIEMFPATQGCSTISDPVHEDDTENNIADTGGATSVGMPSIKQGTDLKREVSLCRLVDNVGSIPRGSQVRRLRGKSIWTSTPGTRSLRKPKNGKQGEQSSPSSSSSSSKAKTSTDQLVPSISGQSKEESPVIPPHVEEACITASMEKEEEKMHNKKHQDDEEASKESMQEWKDMMEHQRFSRLQHLLDKSNVYCTFLLKRMEDQRTQEEKRQKRLDKKQEHIVAKSEQQVPEVKERRSTRITQKHQSDSQQSGGSPGETQTKPAKHGRKRKAEDDLKSYKISDYISKETITKKQKLSEKENKTPLISPKSPTASPNTAEQSVPSKEKSPKSVAAIGSPAKEVEVQYIHGEEVSPLQPALVTGGVLRSYQLEGVEWLKGLYENGVNGILADEMGLGKTVQCIGLVGYLIEMGVRGPFLIAAPLSTLPNWVSEFRRFAPQIPVILYHGSKMERESLRKKISKVKRAGPYETMPVVVTSYEISMNDQKVLQNHMWKHMIVDEGHRIKNLNCRLIKELKSYNSANRLLLTGTPLQNNLAELWSLLNFLLPDIFDDLNSFQRWFDFSAINDEGGSEKIIAQEREHQVLERLHAILTPFLLRRLKSDVELGLPPKKELLVYAPLTSKQTQFYKAALDKTILNIVGDQDGKEEKVEVSSTGRQKRKSRVDVDYKIFDDDRSSFEELAQKITDLQNTRQNTMPSSCKPKSHDIHVRITNILMLLRKCCNHPYLLEYPLDPSTQQFKIDEELVKCSGKMLILDQLVPALRRRGHKILIFSQMTKMLDILQDYCYLRGFDCSRLDGSMKVEDRREQMDEFASDPDKFIFLLSTRAGGLGLNLSAADTVIIYDSDWNPQSDLQAQDRCHRIGQTKPILIYRLVTSNTVDQKIVERAASKRKLEKMVIYKGKFKGKIDATTINAVELKELLESSHHDEIISKDKLILSEFELENLLDRSSMYVKHQDKQAPVPSVPDIDNKAGSTIFSLIDETT